MAWTKEMEHGVIRQHPNDFPNGMEDIVYSFDNKNKQNQGGDQSCEDYGIALQKRCRVLARYSPKQHKMRQNLEREAEYRGRGARHPGAQWAREDPGS